MAVRVPKTPDPVTVSISVTGTQEAVAEFLCQELENRLAETYAKMVEQHASLNKV